MDDELLEHMLTKLSVLGPVTSKPMFGGQGIYVDEAFIALIADDVLYFKVDSSTKADYIAAGMSPFRPFKDKKPMDGYYELPIDVLEDKHKLREWGAKSLAVARASAGAKKPAAREPGFEDLGTIALGWLKRIGVGSRAELEPLGSVEAFRRLQARGYEPAAELLYAMEALLLGLTEERLSEAIKGNLRERAGLEPAAKPTRTKRTR